MLKIKGKGLFRKLSLYHTKRPFSYRKPPDFTKNKQSAVEKQWSAGSSLILPTAPLRATDRRPLLYGTKTPGRAVSPLAPKSRAAKFPSEDRR